MTGIGDTVYSVDKSKLDSTPMKDLGTAKMTELKDLSPLMVDFVRQDKALCLLDSGTGFGKSYSINSFMGLVLQNREAFESVNKIFYITDRRENIKQEYEDFVKRFPLESELVLRVESNLDSVINNVDAFLNLSSKFEDLKEYKELKIPLETYKELEKLKEKTSQKEYKILYDDLNEKIRKKEKAFRDAVKKKLFEKSDPILKSDKYSENIEFLKSDKILCNLLKLYPAILTKGKKIIYLTIDKFFYEYDTIIERKPPFLYQDKELMKKSLIFFDESDAMAGRILDKIVERGSEHPLNIISKIKILYNSFNSDSLPFDLLGSGKDSINSALNEALEKYKNIEKKYHIDHSIVFKERTDSSRWLFTRQDYSIIYKGKGAKEDPLNQYIDLDTTTNQAYIVNEDFLKASGKKIEPDKEYSLFAKDCSSLLHDFYKIIKKMSLNYKKEHADLNYTDQMCIRKVLGLLNFSEDNKITDEVIRNIQYAHLGPIANKEKSSDFYLEPGELVKTELPEDENLMIKLMTYGMSVTPEGFLKSLIDGESKVILSSATAKNKSVIRNFNLNWQPLNDNIFQPSAHSRNLEQKYYTNRERNKEKVNINVEVASGCNDWDLNEKILKYIVKHRKDAERILTNLDELSDYKKDKYYNLIYKNVLHYILDSINKNVSVSLVFLSFGVKSNKSSKKEEQKFFEDFLDNVIKKEFPEFEYFFVLSDNLNKEIEKARKKLRDNKKCFIITTYATAEKGLNFKFKKPVKKDDIVFLNDMGEEEFYKNLDKETGYSDVAVDIDSVFLGPVTNVYSSFDEENIKEKTVEEKVKEILKEAYYMQSMCENGEITPEELEKRMSQILFRKGLYMFDNKCEKDAGRFKVVSTIIQAIGRKCRCNIKKKENYITFHDSLIKKINPPSGYSATVRITEEKIFEKQSFEIKETFNKIDGIRLEKASERRIPYRKLKNKEANIEKAKDENFNKNNPEKLKLIHNITDFSLTKAHFDELKGKISEDVYMQTPKELVGETYYTYASETEIYLPCAKGKIAASIDSLNLTDEKKEILKAKGLSLSTEGFESPDGYILTPTGFNVFTGKIGEILGKDILQKYMLDCKMNELKNLPDEIYERMDDYVEFDNGIFVVDYKYRKELSEESDKREVLQDKYEKKMLEIKDFFDKKNGKQKPIIGLEIDVRDNSLSKEYKVFEVYDNLKDPKLKDSLFICISNVYNSDGSVNKEIFERLSKYINEIL